MTLRELVERAEDVEEAAWQKTAWLAYCFAGKEGKTANDYNPVYLAQIATDNVNPDHVNIPNRTPAEIAKRKRELESQGLI